MFDYFSHKGENDLLSGIRFIQKLLILLLGSQRMNTVYLFTVDRTPVTDIGVTFSCNHVLKHSKLEKFPLQSISQRKVMCCIDRLKEYLKRCNTKVQTDTKALFITYGKPFRAVAIDPVRRWVKELFKETSILKEYTPHTCRSAATSKTSQLNVDIAKMFETWLTFLKHAKTFFNFCRPHEYFDMKLYVLMLFLFTFMLAKQNVYNTNIRSAHLIRLTCRIYNFNSPIRRFLVKILGFEISFNQLMDKVRRNVKLSEYLPSVKLD